MAQDWRIALVALALFAPCAAHAQSADDGRYTIIKPEPWLPPTYQSPRGLPQQVEPVRPMDAPPPPVAKTPPPLVVPQTGAVLPNLPISPSVPNGRETYQDRAARCAHQAGVYGAAAGDRDTYINTCIHQ